MKALMMGVAILSCAITAWGEVFQMDRKGETTVEVKKLAGEYRVTCKFRPQTKFDKAINAKFNDAKGDSLCKKGLARYLKVATNETLAVSGLYSAAPVENAGEMLRYSFGVPVSGCKVAKVEIKLKPPAATIKPIATASVTPQVATNVAPAQGTPALKPKETVPTRTSKIVRKSSYMCVEKYREVNGDRTTISHREYRGRNFKSQKEFDRFCQQEFARIRAIGDANLRAVRNFGK